MGHQAHLGTSAFKASLTGQSRGGLDRAPAAQKKNYSLNTYFGLDPVRIYQVKEMEDRRLVKSVSMLGDDKPDKLCLAHWKPRPSQRTRTAQPQG